MDQDAGKSLPKSVEELLDWKCHDNKEKKLANWPISVEEHNKDKIHDLGWDSTDTLKETDTLYSFLSIYAVGVWAYNRDNCLELNPSMKKIYIKIPRGDSNKKGKGSTSTSRLLCSKNLLIKLQENDGEFKDHHVDVKELNQVLGKFVAVYFSLGNTIPIWPSGNMDRGNQNNGSMDIPELYFNQHKRWFNILKKENPNAHLEILNVDDKRYESLYSFLMSIKTPQDYELFVDYIVSVINIRTKLMNEGLVKMPR